MKTKLKNKQIAALDREVFPMLDAIKEAVLGAYLTVTPEEYATGRQYGDLPAAKQTFAICGMLKNITEHQMARYTGDKRITIHNRKRAGFRFYCGDKRFRARADLVFKNLKINPADVAYVLEKFY